MPNLLESKDFGLKIYNRFPPKYREDDVDQNYALKRYLESLSDGGYSPVIEEINGITDLVNPEKVDAKLLPVLFQQYGLPIFKGIPESYLRYLLPKLGEAYEQKGSITSIEFVTSALAGVKVVIEVNGMELNIKFEMDYNTIDSYFPDEEHFGRIFDKFLPFYFGRKVIYSYIFFEDQRLNTRERSVANVIKQEQDVGFFARNRLGVQTSSNSPDKLLNSTFILNEEPNGPKVITHNDLIKTQYHDGIIFRIEDYANDLEILPEGSSLKSTDKVVKEKMTSVYTDTTTLSSVGKRGIGYSMMGGAILGEAIFGVYEDLSDVCQDVITYRGEKTVINN